MAELYLATLAIHVGSDVMVDDPEYSSGGKNPDVIFTLHPDPGHARRWAFAIKTIGRGTNPQSIFDRINDGAGQIDDSAADLGIVIINTKNALPHEYFWNTAYPDEAAAINDLRSHINELKDRADLNRPQTEWDALFAGKCVRPIAFMGQTVVRLNTAAGGPFTPTLLRSFVLDHAKSTGEPEAMALLETMNFFMWSVSEGAPSSQGVLPK
jgi:hypothetical protein